MKKKIAIVVLFAGCAHYAPMSVSTSGLGPKEHPLAVVMGQASSYRVLFFFGPFGDASLVAAINNAKGSAAPSSDTLSNVFVDREILNVPFDFLPLYRQVTTTVYGTLIRYDDPSFKRAEEKKAEASPKFEVSDLSHFQKGESIEIKLTDGRSVLATFSSYIPSQNVVWIKTGTGFFSSRAISTQYISKVRSHGKTD